MVVEHVAQPGDAALVAAVDAGMRFEPPGKVPDARDKDEVWPSGRTVSAGAVRQLALQAHPDPHGIRMTGVRVVGPLDLENVHCAVEFDLQECFLDGGVVLRDAALGPMAFTRCRIRSDGGTDAFDARRVQLPILYLDESDLVVDGDGHSLTMNSAHVAGRLNLSGALFASAADGISIFADGITVDGGLFAHGAGGRPMTSIGAIRLPGARVTGQLDFSGARINGSDHDGDSLIADRLSVSGDLLLNDDEGSSLHTEGAVRLPGSHITGALSGEGSDIGANHQGVALNADGATIDAAAHLTMSATSAFRARGAVRFAGATVSGLLNLTGAQILGSDSRGASLIADRLTVNGTLLMRAHTSGSFQAAGQVRLPGARISGVLDASGAHITGASDGISMLCDRMTVNGDVDLGDRETAHFATSASVSLRAATVNGRLKGAIAAMGAGDVPALSLKFATLGEVCLEPNLPGRDRASVELDGATYKGVPTGTPEQWIHLLRHHTQSFAPQPYQQLATSFDGVGNKKDAVDVRIAQQDDRRDRHLRSPGAPARTRARLFFRRLGLRFEKATIGYGFRTWPAFVGVIFFALVGAGLGLAAGATASGSHRVAYRPPSAAPGQRTVATNCSSLEQAALGIHIPFLSDLPSGACELDTTRLAGEGIVAAIWAANVLIWASATLAVAGYTGLVRQT